MINVSVSRPPCIGFPGKAKKVLSLPFYPGFGSVEAVSWKSCSSFHCHAEVRMM